MKLGSFEIEIISDGSFALDGGAMFSVVPRVLWEQRFAPDERNRIRLGLNCLLVRAGAHNVLIDTGMGRKWDERSRDRYAIGGETSLLAGLRRRGLSPEDIHFVVNTHLHFDHAGTNTLVRDGRAVPAFPRARYVAQRGEFEHACSPHERDRASYVPDDFIPVAEARQLDLVDGDAEIVPGVRALKVGGHNRDMQCVRVDSEGETAFFFADLMPTTAHVQPAWVMSYDLYPVETLERKKSLLPAAIDEGWACVFYHDPRVPLARLSRDGAKIAVAPIGEQGPGAAR